jgi:hypothetical protein
MKHLHFNHYTIMFFIMVISGLLSTMNVWVDKLDDIRFSLNDVYMTLLMTGWMFFFMGLIYQEINVFFIGLSLVIVNIWCIRNQFLITETQYKLGMIPHHSMAIHMSKQLLEKEKNTSSSSRRFIQNIIDTQENEITILKKNEL